MNSKTYRVVYSIILWVAAALLMVYAIWAFIRSADIISQAKATGQLAGSGSGYVVISFYMDSSLVYLVYALALAALGMLLQKKDSITAAHVSHRDDSDVKRGYDEIKVDHLLHANEPEDSMDEETEDRKDSEESELLDLSMDTMDEDAVDEDAEDQDTMDSEDSDQG